MKKTPLCIILYFALCLNAFGIEWKSNVLSSVSTNGEFDLIFNSHNTLLVGGSLKLGPYLGYEHLHSYITDLAYGGAIRFGGKGFVELQGGYLERQFRDYQSLTGKGFVVNLLFGSAFTDTFGFTLLFSAKKIETGMDPRWIYKVLPYLGVTFDF